ncbi:MAG: helix-turn-helix domain-containing protein [Planctomycetaceae bacterium]|nr:helix-turn-helix domain-containing protein [Planctomycetaceae bacterium]
MTRFTLDSEQRAELEFLASYSAIANERCRALALLWLDEGETVEQVAELLHVSRQTIYTWINRLRDRSASDVGDSLIDAPRSGRPRAGQGSVDSLIAEVIDRDPRTLGYRSTIWTATLLEQYLKDYHCIEVSRKTISRAIERLDMCWKRPRYQLGRRPETWQQSKGGSNTGSRTAFERCC